ncbi:MAG: hypothetical protein ACREX8_10590 [Gammaproteobacteria bacterium]
MKGLDGGEEDKLSRSSCARFSSAKVLRSCSVSWVRWPTRELGRDHRIREARLLDGDACLEALGDDGALHRPFERRAW